MVTDIVYVDHLDQYFIAYSGESTAFLGFPAVGRMDPNGNWLGHTIVSNVGNVHAVDIAYNSDDPGFFYVYRYEGTNAVFGAYLDSDGNVIPGTEIPLGAGGSPKVEYSPDAGTYLVAIESLTFRTLFRILDGDPTNPNPLLWVHDESHLSYSPDLAYGGGKFLAVYIRDFANTDSDIWGRFIDPTGALGPLFSVETRRVVQQFPRAGFDPSANRFIVTYSSWTGSPLFTQAKLVDPASGAVTGQQTIHGVGGVYEITQSIVYNPTTATTVFAHYHGAPSFAHLYVEEFEVTSNSITPVGAGQVLLSNQFGAVTDGAARPVAEDPQATFLYLDNLGHNGIHAGILHVTPPPPDETAPAAAVLGGFEGPGPNQVTVTWNAPGDDGSDGQADSYDLRYSLTSPFNFATATPVATGSPQFAGTPEAVVIDGIPPETLVYIGLKTSDEVPNVSTLSNIAELNSPGVPPAAVSDLMASSPGGSTAQLNWTATGDDGVTGTATAYDLRYATFPINDANFDSATPLLNPPVPGPPGTPESFVATGLPPETMIYFGIKVVDDANLKSPADTGAEPSITTLDLMAPEKTTDLAADASGGADDAPAARSDQRVVADRVSACVERDRWEPGLLLVVPVPHLDGG